MSTPPSAPAEERVPARAVDLPTNPPPPEPKGPLGRRILARLFDPATRTGRFMRPFVRGLAAVVGLFALGLLAGYTLLYQPLERQYRTVAAQLTVTSQDLESKQEALRQSAAVLVGSESERKTTASALEKTTARLALQQALNRVQETRLALAAKDSPAARVSFSALEKDLHALQPQLLRLAAISPDSLNRVLELVKSDLGRDAGLAEQDLRRLISELTLIDQALQ